MVALSTLKIRWCVEYRTQLLNTRQTNNERQVMEKIKYKKNPSSESAFTACTARISLLETMTDAAENAAGMATILLSTARSSFDELQNARKSGLKLCFAVQSISWGRNQSHPNISGEIIARRYRNMLTAGNRNFSFRAFLREKHEANNSIIQTSIEKGR